MSNSEEQPVMPFEITAPEDAFRIELFDGSGTRIWEGTGPTTQQLPRGLYQVRTIAGEVIRDQFVRHASGPTHVAALAPAYETAAPLEGAATSREYYTAAAVRCSTTLTGSPLGPNTDKPDLFVFVRAKDADSLHGQALRTSLYVRSEKGPRIPIEAGGPVHEGSEGWVALSVPAKPGVYYLGTEHAREMPLHIMDGWCTQVFVSATTKAHLSNASIFLGRRGEPFEPGSAVMRAVDRGLKGLQGETDIPPRDLKLLLADQYENPMLGLIAAHLILHRERGPSRVTSVIHALRSLLPDCVDLRALEVRAARRTGERWIGQRFSTPPMLRAGFVAVQKYAIDHESLVDEPLLDIAANLVTDSPWTQWTTDADPAHALGQLEVALLQQMVGENITNVTVDARRLANALGVSPDVIRRAQARVDAAVSRSGHTARELFTQLIGGEATSSVEQTTRRWMDQARGWLEGVSKVKVFGLTKLEEIDLRGIPGISFERLSVPVAAMGAAPTSVCVVAPEALEPFIGYLRKRDQEGNVSIEREVEWKSGEADRKHVRLSLSASDASDERLLHDLLEK